MKNSVEIVACDAFGDTLANLLRQTIQSFQSNNDSAGRLHLETINCTVVIGRLENVRLKLLAMMKLEKRILPIIFWADSVYLGSAFNPGDSSCPNCLVMAILRHCNAQYAPNLVEIEASALTNSRSLAFMPNVLPNSALLILNSLLLNDNEFENTNKVNIYNINSGKISHEYLLPEVSCNHTSNEKRSTKPKFEENKSVKAHSKTRTRSLDSLHSFLKNVCFGKKIGLVDEISFDFQMPFASCSVHSIINKVKREPTLGRAQNFTSSATIAILESLERLSGFKGDNNIVSCEASYNEIKDKALDPRMLGLHSKSQYKMENFAFLEYEDDLKLHWIEASNLSLDRSVWVPHCAGFYGHSTSRNQPSIIYETSNGCAIGCSMEEAILHGILELIERDSFLVTWYNKLKLPEITEQCLAFEGFHSLFLKSSLFTKAKIQIFDSTMEHGIPSVLAKAYSDEPDMPATAVSAGVGLTLEEAAVSALYELSGHYLRLRYLLNQSGAREKAVSMLSQPLEVKSMEDHGLINCLPEAADRFDFLYNGNKKSTINSLDNSIFHCSSPIECLNILVSQLKRGGFDVIAVDQTSETLKALNLFAAKVIIPNFVPMTFGYRHCRLEVPRIHKSEGVALQFNETLPHPFP